IGSVLLVVILALVWPIPEVTSHLVGVRLLRQVDLLRLSSSHFDPYRTSRINCRSRVAPPYPICGRQVIVPLVPSVLAKTLTRNSFLLAGGGAPILTVLMSD